MITLSILFVVLGGYYVFVLAVHKNRLLYTITKEIVENPLLIIFPPTKLLFSVFFSIKEKLGKTWENKFQFEKNFSLKNISVLGFFQLGFFLCVKFFEKIVRRTHD
uniref:Uncharacterized protein n=1 Tax=Cacopsylla melanoneura TaxID=428564 RepID=A0A8D8T4A3_9HEMI